MAELLLPETRRCSFFFLYDGSKVRGEGDLTREGICYFYPEETPVDHQELICGQLAGVGRCVSELSLSPVRVLRLRRNKFAVCMKEDFFWALGCSVDVPTVSVCRLLDRLIDLFCFYNGSVRQSYQLNSREALASRWALYLAHLQSGPSELQHVFSCLQTLDSTNVDPLLLLKAALILQACQRCPLVVAGCILFRGRVVSTQMVPELTMKVTVHESETHAKARRQSSSGPCGGAVSSTTVFLTPAELQNLHSTPVHKESSSQAPPPGDTPPAKTRLSRTLSDMASSESDPSDPGPCCSPQKVSFSLQSSDDSVFSPAPPPDAATPPPPPPPPPQTPLSNGNHSQEQEQEEEQGEEQQQEEDQVLEPVLDQSNYVSFHGAGGGGPSHLNGGSHDEGVSGGRHETAEDPRRLLGASAAPPAAAAAAAAAAEEGQLVPMTLYLHRVKGLVLALLVEPLFLSDTESMEEVYHSSLASLNGLEAHLRSVGPGAPAAPGPYMFAHFDSVQSTMTTNLSAGAGAVPERPFVRATSLLHSHFCSSETLQEAIIRRAHAAVYGTRTVAQETYFQQHGGSLRNSGIPNHQDSAFSLPSKARHRLLKHGVNLL
ncbi:uncharacterized protein V6R79_015654 [Siganus canaliculatus]